MAFGWRPEDVHGAPIPLYYDFETFDPPYSPIFGTEFAPYYIGYRFNNSLEMHKQFANKLKATGPESFPAYHFKFPPNENLLEAFTHGIKQNKRL